MELVLQSQSPSTTSRLKPHRGPKSLHEFRSLLAQDPYQSRLVPSYIQCLKGQSLEEEAHSVALAWVGFDNGFESLKSLGDSFLSQGQETEAYFYFLQAKETAIEKDEAYIDLCLKLCNLQIKAKNLTGAESLLSEALALNPQSDAAYSLLGTLKVLVGQIEVANSAFRKSVELKPDNDKSWTGLALIHLSKGDFDLALANAQRALDVNPMNRVALELAVRKLWEQSQWAKSLQYLVNFFSKTDFDTDFSILLAHNLVVLNQIESARWEIERALCWDPKNQQLQKISLSLCS